MFSYSSKVYADDFTYKYILPQEYYSSVLDKFAENHSSSYKSSLTEEEIRAIGLYIGSEHQPINDHLDSIANSGPRSRKYDQYNLIVDRLTSAIKKAPLKEPIIVYRGLAATIKNNNKVQVGGIWHGFSSTSVKFTTAAHFATNCSSAPWLSGEGAVIALHLPAGTPALVVGTSEKEFLLPPGITYTVIAEDRPLKIEDPWDNRCVYTCDFKINPDFHKLYKDI